MRQNAIICLLAFLIGCNVNSSTEVYDDQTIEKARERVESYFRHNYEDVGKVSFIEDTSDPMGGLMINGTVNGAEFSASVEPNQFIVNSVGETEGFPNVKEECREKVCDY
ncbi:DUF1433 domain-containing protein [Pseudalkalibacillus hwajinpoensis]|uniref:DUF1433 domain-containing protein n=1 Tax=Guptibacillus hwajinpoensis TaxID=208199 RepID=A0A4U1MMP5_9BACL|nr:DUF1433 domain-containing protein [Pseudalkalibacillus hwajinpoensis]TKD72237.1 DUF1433 domain-containing protein [Pseudalkalibacillus hwajinpoensis]